MEETNQTKSVFSNKWNTFNNNVSEKEKLFEVEKRRYLELYGFKNETELSNFLSGKAYVLDAGCGIGYKAAWFAQLSPSSHILGIDFSDSIEIASEKYKNIQNLDFIKWDLMKLSELHTLEIDFISCDQVLHHTQNPDNVLDEFSKVLNENGEMALYVYRKKALPRELLDDQFRKNCKTLSKEDLIQLSEQLTKLGKELSKIETSLNVPDIPALGISGGVYSIQRFIYYNFLKCYWNEEMGFDNSMIFNYDWYGPSIAKRYSKKEFKHMLIRHNLKNVFFYEDGSCFAGRFSGK